MTTPTRPTSPPSPQTTSPGRVPTYPVLLGVVVAVCTGGMALNLLGAMAIGVVDEGPRTLGQQLAGVLGFGTAGLVACLLLVPWLSRTPARSRVGAVVLGVLAVPCLVFFFSGLPGMLGASAAHLAGLTRGRTPLAGAPRAAGLVGLVIALLNVLVAVVGITVAWLSELA